MKPSLKKGIMSCVLNTTDGLIWSVKGFWVKKIRNGSTISRNRITCVLSQKTISGSIRYSFKIQGIKKAMSLCTSTRIFYVLLPGGGLVYTHYPRKYRQYGHWEMVKRCLRKT